MDNILITGSKGQLGLELSKLIDNFSNYTFFLADKSVLNITDYKAVENYVSENKISVIINCAAYTNVDKAEEEPELADAINHLAVKNLAEIAKKHQIKLVHISTDYVFDGTSKTPYLENDKTNPKNRYGLTKLKGEEALKLINPDNSIILRTSWLYSEFGKNFVKTMLRLGEEKESISVVSDQIGSPTYAGDLALAILQIIPALKSNGVQIYHYANQGACSWFEFAEEIIGLSKYQCEVKPIPGSEFKTKAVRPNYSLLNTEKIQADFKLDIPHWKDSLQRCIEKLG
jgi:dTDP-4-dehydrorhamnose reductase